MFPCVAISGSDELEALWLERWAVEDNVIPALCVVLAGGAPQVIRFVDFEEPLSHWASVGSCPGICTQCASVPLGEPVHS